MRTLWLFLIACGGRSPSPPPTPAPAPVPPPIAGIARPPAAGPLGTTAAIDITNLKDPYGDHHAIWIDEAGRAAVGNSHVLRVNKFAIVLPFTAPVEEVVYVTHVGSTGRIYCARTRPSLECVNVTIETKQDGTRVVTSSLHFTPTREPVTHVGTAHQMVCARFASGTGACWSPTPDGKQLFSVNADAVAVATKLPPDIAAAWQRADAAATLANMKKIVVSPAPDDERLLPAGHSVATWCALLADETLACYGPGVYGELGDGKLAATARASRPLGSTRVRDVSMHGRAICAITDDGALSCWGEHAYPSSVAPRAKTTRHTRCALDRAASLAQFTARRDADARDVKACSAACDRDPVRDCHLHCTPRCNPEPYLFVHPPGTLCVEPTPTARDGQISSRFGDPCRLMHDRTPQWLTDAELYVPEHELLLSPVRVAKIKNATRLAVWGPDICVLDTAHAIACVPR